MGSLTVLLTGLAGPTALMSALCGYAVWQRHRWASRRINPLLGWRVVLPAATVVGLAIASLTHQQWGTGAGLAAAAFGWLGTVAAATDLKTYKIPWDLPHPVAAVGLVCFAFNYSTEGMLALCAATVGVVGVPLLARLLTSKGLGLSDVRLLWAAVTTTSWWLGQTWLLYALIVAAGIQVLLRVMTVRREWGELVPAAETKASAQPRPRRALPFAPALALSLFAAIGYGTHTGYGACQMWNVLGGC